MPALQQVDQFALTLFVRFLKLYLITDLQLSELIDTLVDQVTTRQRRSRLFEVLNQLRHAQTQQIVLLCGPVEQVFAQQALQPDTLFDTLGDLLTDGDFKHLQALQVLLNQALQSPRDLLQTAEVGGNQLGTFFRISLRGERLKPGIERFKKGIEVNLLERLLVQLLDVGAERVDARNR